MRTDAGTAAAAEQSADDADDPTFAAELPRRLHEYWSAIRHHATVQGLNVSQRGGGGARGGVGSASWWKRCRRFAVGSRRDYQTSIKQALKTLGLCETSTPHWEVREPLE
jgi:hypothetical protein